MLNESVCLVCTANSERKQNDKLKSDFSLALEFVDSTRKSWNGTDLFKLSTAFSLAAAAAKNLDNFDFSPEDHEVYFKDKWAKGSVYCPHWHDGSRAMKITAKIPTGCPYRLEQVVSQV